jgi:hypothetical protein
MNILALDLGTNTGFAYNDGDRFVCGTWLLASDKELRAQKKVRGDRTTDCRVRALFHQLRKMYIGCNFDWVVFEDVQFSSSTMQTQLWSSLRAAVWLAAAPDSWAMHPPVIECVPTGTLKKFAGHGSATKEMMGLFLCRADNRFCRIGKINPKFFFRKSEDQLQPVDDNAIDAVWLHRWAQHNLSRK